VGKALGRTWIVDIFDLWLDNAADLGYAEEDSLGYRFVAWLEKVAFHHADHIMVLTATMKKFYLKKHSVKSNRLTSVPFGVNEELFTPSIETEPESRIIYIGNLGTFYVFEPYFRAFSQLDDEYELYVVGWGEERERLETLCSELGITDRVTFTGRVPREEVPQYLASAALNWVPLETNYELDYARPTKLLEGMAIGTPYVASPLAEIEVMTEESDAGLTVKNDSDAIAAAMEKILADPDRQQKMAENAVEYVNQHHRWPELSNQVGRIIFSATVD